MLSYFEDMIII